MNYPKTFDRLVVSAVEKLPQWLHPVMLWASYLGTPLVMAFILVIVMAVSYSQRHANLVIAQAATLAFLPMASIIKLITQRARPETIYVENMLVKTYSFPSGHAYASLLVLGFLIFLCVNYISDPWKWLLAGFLAFLILLIGISRIYLGAHFPSDVLGGWLLGGLVLILVIKFIVKP
ncbi:phosphatase PAP2 family protein [Candidatus Parcubacteria bacterium]|nr:phosphatase PAP2 family protein [Candidatus Parcubacteria bacterium]